MYPIIFVNYNLWHREQALRQEECCTIGIGFSNFYYYFRMYQSKGIENQRDSAKGTYE